MPNAESIHVVDAILEALQKNPSDCKARAEQLTRMRNMLPGVSAVIWPNVGFSYMFGQHFSALVTCGAFVDCLLQELVRAEYARVGRSGESIPWKLESLIDLAVRLEIVSEEDGPLLHDFRRFVRNKFAHGDASGIAGSLFSIKAGWEANPGGEITELTEPALDALRTDSLTHRFRQVVERYSRSVIPWISLWARKVCENANRRRHPTQEAQHDSNRAAGSA